MAAILKVMLGNHTVEWLSKDNYELVGVSGIKLICLHDN